MVVYFHRNPKTYEIFYVGIGSETGRCQRPRAKTNRNNYWYNYVNKHGTPVIQIVFTGLERKEAFYWERYYILLLGKKIEGGQLVNLSNGGESNEGYKRSKETRMGDSERAKKRSTAHMLTKEARQKVADKLSVLFKGKLLGAENPNYGNKWSSEMKSRMSFIKRNQPPVNLKPIKVESSGEIFDSIKTAAIHLGIPKSTLSYKLRTPGKNNTGLIYCLPQTSCAI